MRKTFKIVGLILTIILLLSLPALASSGGEIPPPTPPEPTQKYGEFFCDILDRTFNFMPSTPPQLTLPYLADRVGQLGFIGTDMARAAISDLRTVGLVIAGVKLVKMLPAQF